MLYISTQNFEPVTFWCQNVGDALPKQDKYFCNSVELLACLDGNLNIELAVANCLPT